MKYLNIFLIESKVGFVDDLGCMVDMFCYLGKFSVEFYKIGVFYKRYLN